MKDKFTPDYMFEHYYDITPDFLLSIGISALLIDIDNTLAPYEQPTPDERHFVWFDSLREKGISVALISNNHKERVELFNKDLGLLAYPDSGKPGKKSLLDAMSKMGSDRQNTAVLGDQLFTDSYAGKRLGLVSIIVPPIKDKTTLFFKSKRFLERPFIKKYKKLHPKDESNT